MILLISPADRPVQRDGVRGGSAPLTEVVRLQREGAGAAPQVGLPPLISITKLPNAAYRSWGFARALCSTAKGGSGAMVWGSASSPPLETGGCGEAASSRRGPDLLMMIDPITGR